MGCDDKCGCAVPCPGGPECRCTSRSGVQRHDHTTCVCGEHCSCNPCECGRAAKPSGHANRRATCTCGESCTCGTCSA